MNGVIGMLNLLLETPLDGTQLDYAETARSRARAVCADQRHSGPLQDRAESCGAHPAAPARRARRCARTLRRERRGEEKCELAAFVADDVPETLLATPSAYARFSST
ncbi:hypothetical protein CLOM_g416 [Closterium sp. NIES-68]|nr:hypothetical protein CLOM_g416 [Closterium sp. NIES-68]